MESLADTLQEVRRALDEAVGVAFRSGDLRYLDDASVMALMAEAAGIVRRAEGVLLATVAEVQERADAAPQGERPTTRYGCRSMKELIQRTTRASGRTVGDLLRGAKAIRQPISMATGQLLPAQYPAMREAAADGEIGLDALVAVVGSLDSAACGTEARWAADGELAASASGCGEGGGPVPDPDELRLQAQVWTMYLDQDGAEPREARALRKRGFTMGVCRDELVPFRGNALPEVAAQMQRLFDSILNPKGDGPDTPAGPHFVELDENGLVPAVDDRSRAMRQHDALAMILAVAARAGELPTIGGAAPTLVVSVAAADLESGRGHAHIDGCEEPVPLAVARQVACAGAVQRVSTDRGGRILAIGIPDRVFASHQRKAISLRDGGCIIAGLPRHRRVV